MSKKDMELMKKLLEEKKKKTNFFGGDKKIGVGKVQQGVKYIGTMQEHTKK
ncbi:MAG: hypothetical protein ACRC7V_06880 [Lachnospiraceae bacterium]